MSDVMNNGVWLSGKSDTKRFVLAFAAGLLLEAAALAVLLPVMTHQPPPPADHQDIVKLSIQAPAPPKPPAPTPPKPTPPKPVPLKPVPPPPKTITPPLPPPPPLPVAPPMPMPPPPPPPHRAIVHRRPPPRPVARPPVTLPLAPPVTPPIEQPPPPPAPAMPAAPSAGELDLFQAAMRRAVQAEANGVEPPAAIMAHQSGVARISFRYQDGIVSDIQVIASSGFPLLDAAAEQAARDASYPPTPPDFAGRPYQVIVDVIFRAASASVDSD